jgi:hypothetical protein
MHNLFRSVWYLPPVSMRTLKSAFSNVIRNKSYSQCLQDLFVLYATSYRLAGSYLEVGAAHPHGNSNSFKLDTEFQYEGISIEYDPNLVSQWRSKRRRNRCICADATSLDYSLILSNLPPLIDYLSLDINPSIQTLNVLKVLPLDKVRFSVITFEHDAYSDADGEAVRNESREILNAFGYTRVISDVELIEWGPFEDWYVDPLSVGYDIISTLQQYDNPKIKQSAPFESTLGKFLLQSYIQRKSLSNKLS